MSKKTTTGHKRRIHSAPHDPARLASRQDPRATQAEDEQLRHQPRLSRDLRPGERLRPQPPTTGLDGAPLHAMGGPKRLLPQERLRGLPRPDHLPRLRRAAGNVCGGDRPPRGQPPMAKPWQLRLLPKRGDGTDRVGRRDGEEGIIPKGQTTSCNTKSHGC